MTESNKCDGASTGENTSRRDFLKVTSATTATGVLGTLAGCLGGNGGGGGSGSGSNGGDGGSGGSDSTGDDGSGGGSNGGGGGKESITLRYLTPDPTESPQHKTFYQEQMKRFEEREGNVKVDLQSMAWGTLAQKLPAMARNNDLPDVSMSGATGLQLSLEGDYLIDHGKFLEETEGIPENFHHATVSTMKYRDTWWSSGSMYTQATMGAIRPSFFKEVGVSDPSELETWTGFRRAIDEIDRQFPDTYAFEETGDSGDLESYWGEARTSYTDGTDPWMDVTDEGSYENPSVKIGKEPRTDGMIKNCIDMGLTYSSPQVASRTNEELPALMLTDRVASCLHTLGRAAPWTTVKSDVTFGWDGDIDVLPMPRLDSDYGAEFGIDELAGKSGQPGGNGWGYDIMHTGFKSTASPEKAWALMDYVNRDPDFVLPYLGEIQTTAPAYTELFEPLKDEYEIPPPQATLFDLLSEWPDQVAPCGDEWDIPNIGDIRSTDINRTISQALAGQITKEQAPKKMRSRVLNTLNGS